MPHITFIHGIENKPSPRVLLDQWQRALAADDGLDLAAVGVTTSMVYWADVLYPSPLAELVSEAVTGSDPESAQQVLEELARAAKSREEMQFLAGVTGKLSMAMLSSSAAVASSSMAEERIPIPWALKEPLMAALLRDVHHYLFNTTFSPSPGKTYQVQTEIRRRFVNAISGQTGISGLHVVVSHSMGTVIAYDCLKRVSGCPAVDGLITIGSPLGLDEIQDKLRPEWTQDDGFPQSKVRGTWLNVFDLLDPVDGFDPNLADDYEQNRRRVVVDVRVTNHGWWRHNISEYLSRDELRDGLRAMLKLPAGRATQRPASGRLVESSSKAVSQQARTEFRSGAPSDVDQSSESPADRRVRPVLIGDVRRALAIGVPSRGAPNQSIRSAGRDLAETVASVGTQSAEQISLVCQIAEAVRVLSADAAEHGEDVMSSPTHKLASLVQSAVASFRDTAGIEEMPFDNADVKEILDKVRQHDVTPHPQPRPKRAKADAFPDRAKLLLVSDFGTGLYGAPVIAATAKSQQYDLLVHLGDIYYSGQMDEVQHRFLDLWPTSAGAISRTLNGNHDMYSGGYGYFDLALRAFGQPSSYFALQNRNWLFLFLDTAYKDNNLGKRQLAWISEVVSAAGDRKILLFSHHPLFSNFKPQGQKLAEKLADLLQRRRITAWYWGHEHHAVLYDIHRQFGLLGRCLGNGGMPSKRKDLADYPVEQSVGSHLWRRAPAGVTPSCLYLDGPNPYIIDDDSKYGPHGFMTLELDGPNLRETVHSASGESLYSQQIAF